MVSSAVGERTDRVIVTPGRICLAHRPPATAVAERLTMLVLSTDDQPTDALPQARSSTTCISSWPTSRLTAEIEAVADLVSSDQRICSPGPHPRHSRARRRLVGRPASGPPAARRSVDRGPATGSGTAERVMRCARTWWTHSSPEPGRGAAGPDLDASRQKAADRRTMALGPAGGATKTRIPAHPRAAGAGRQRLRVRGGPRRVPWRRGTGGRRLVWSSARRWAPHLTRRTSTTGSSGRRGRRLGRAAWTPRQLRHSFVSLLSNTGISIEDISHFVRSRVTEVVDRKELRPVLTRGATRWTRSFRVGVRGLGRRLGKQGTQTGAADGLGAGDIALTRGVSVGRYSI